MTLSNESIARYRNDKDGLDKQELYYAIDKLCDSHESLREQVKENGNLKMQIAKVRESAIKEVCKKLNEKFMPPLPDNLRQITHHRCSPELYEVINFIHSLLSPPSEEVQPLSIHEIDDAIRGLRQTKIEVDLSRFNREKMLNVLEHYKSLRSQPEAVKPVEINREEFRIGQSIVWNGKLGYIYWRGIKDDVSKEPLVNFNLAGGGFVCNIPESQIEPKYETD